MEKHIIVKRIFAFVMSFVMLVTGLPVNFIVAAQPEAAPVKLTLTADKTEVNPGDVITVDVNINENTQIIAADFVITYDSQKLELANEKDEFDSYKVYCPLIDGTAYDKYWTIVTGTNTAGQYHYVMTTQGSNYAIKSGGTIGRIKLKVKDGVKGKIDLGLKVVQFATDLEGTGTGTEVSTSTTNNTDVYVPVPLEGISIPEKLTLNVGFSSNKLPITLLPADASVSSKEVATWKSDRTEVATVEDGVITAHAIGNANITVTYAGKSDTCVVTVEDPLKSIKLDKEELSLERGSKYQLNIVTTPDPATGIPTFTWRSESDSVATVEQNGMVTAVGKGQTKIIVESSDKKFTAECVVNVTIPIKGIKLDKSDEHLRRGIEGSEQTTLVATVDPVDATEDTSVVWVSDNQGVVKVEKTSNNTANVIAVGNGTAKVIASIGGKETSCKFTVTTAITSISFGKTEDSSLSAGQNDQLNVTFLPADYNESDELVWSTSAEDIATVENGLVKTKTFGTVEIKAELKSNPDVFTTCEYTVQPVKATSVQLNYSNLTLNKNESKNLVATVLPENTTDSKAITWSSSDNTKVSVSQEGKITALAACENVVIKATSVANPDLFDECSVTVLVPQDGIEISDKSLNLKRGISGEDTYTLTYKITPEDTTDKPDVTWSTSNSSVATVDQEGNVKAVGHGTAQITVSAGGFSAVCTVTVSVPLLGISIKEQDQELLLGQTLDLTLVNNPEDTDDMSKVEWSSSSDTIATVDENGKVTALTEGEVIITAKKAGYTATTTIKTKRIPLGSIAIKNVITEMLKGKSEKLEVIFDPDNTTDPRDIEWSSSDEDVAIVDENGVVTALKAGEVTITAKSSMEGVEPATIKFTVKEVNIGSVLIDKDEYTDKDLRVGDEFYLSYSLNPEEATDNYTYKWLSSDDSIATIDENGKVTALKEGKVVFTLFVVSEYGEEYTDTFEVYIQPELVENVDSPDTGDINILFVLSLMFISFVAIVVISKKKALLTK